MKINILYRVINIGIGPEEVNKREKKSSIKSSGENMSKFMQFIILMQLPGFLHTEKS